MDVTSLVLVIHKLQDHGDEGDDGRAEDGDGVVYVVPGHLSGLDVFDLSEPQPDFRTDTSHPEEGREI